MTRLTFTALAVAVSLAVASTGTPLLASGAPGARQAQEQDHQEHHPASEPQAEAQPQGSAGMMQMHQMMMANMKSMDDSVTGLVAKMNAATGEAKVAAMAELLTAVVQQHSGMRQGMMQMQGCMMGQMMAHMGTGASPAMTKAMAGCSTTQGDAK
jgi:hypothetical protein